MPSTIVFSNEAVTVSNTWADAQDVQRVWMWDVGPEKPVPPKRPTAPQGKEGNPEFDLAKVEFAEALEEYGAALKAHKAGKAAYADWTLRYGGPIEQSHWSCDASDALVNDERAVKEGRQTRKRFYISDKTRGYKALPNRGLPENVKPGHGQADIERRAAEEIAEMVAAGQADPVFGRQQLRGA